MKLTIFFAAMALFSNQTHARMTYECFGYKDGKPVSNLTSYVKVLANNKKEAKKKAIEKYSINKKKVDEVKCK